MNSLEKAITVVSSVLLILVGVVGVIIGVADFAGWDKLLLSTKEPLSVVLSSIGILSIALGLERVIYLRRLEHQLLDLRHAFSRSVGVQHLKSYDAIYEAASRLCMNARSHIRTVVSVTSKPIKTPHNWAESIAKRLRDSKKAYRHIKFDPVIVVDFEKLTLNYLNGFKQRYALYEKYGVIDIAMPNLLNTKCLNGFDVFIIDREHVIIAYTTYSRVGELQSGLLFENHPSIASEFADWFDQIILKTSVPFDEWLNNKYKLNTKEWVG